MPNERFSYALPGDPSRGNLRALRRHHKARMQARAIFIHTKFPVRGRTAAMLDADRDFAAERVERARRQADNISGCSCDMCANPRNSSGTASALQRLTVQEQRVLFEYLQTVRVGLPDDGDYNVTLPAFVCQEV